MERTREAAERIRRIEVQQDEILRELEELERRTEAVLAQYVPRRCAEAIAPEPSETGPAGHPPL